MSSHICVDVGYVVMLHEHLFERHCSAAIRFIKIDCFGIVPKPVFPTAICFDLLDVGGKAR